MRCPTLSSASERSQSPTLEKREVHTYAQAWLVDQKYRRLSPRTIETRRIHMDQLQWWMEQTGLDSLDSDEIKAFLAYVTDAQPSGRWGNPAETRENRPLTTFSYFGILRTFFRWLVAEGYIEANPMDRVRAPVKRSDQIVPFAPEQVDALLAEARRSDYPVRNEAILLLLLDTGLRAAELCSIRVRDLDLPGRRIVVMGKGTKQRAVYLGPTTARAINRYLRWRGSREPGDALFWSEKAHSLTTSGLLRMIHRLGERAGLSAVRCSPHTFRHTAAVLFLRAGGNAFALREMLGHTTLAMTQRYVALAQADVQAQHAQFSPVESLHGKR